MATRTHTKCILDGTKKISIFNAVVYLSSVIKISVGEDADDMYPAASGLRMLGDNLAAARARLSRGRGEGRVNGTNNNNNNVPPSAAARENRGDGGNRMGTPTVKSGGRW